MYRSFSGCGESLLHSLFLCLNLFLCVNTDKKEEKESDTPTKKIWISTTDSGSGFLMRDGKPNDFHFLDHRTTDAKYNIITDTYVTAGNMADSEPYLARLQAQIDKFGFKAEAVALDAGYFSKFYYFMLFSFTKIKKNRFVLRSGSFFYTSVKIIGSPRVTTTVCSHCATRLLSGVTNVQPSSPRSIM